MNVDHFDAVLDGKACEVYFFASWATYDHPVKPTHPIHFEEALLREGYYRAWMCKDGPEPQFVLFESIENEREALELTVPTASDVSLFQPRAGAKPPAIERPLQLPDLVGRSEYLVSTKADAGKVFLVRQRVIYSYRYRYNARGTLASATITNVDGKVKVLDGSP